ncbi:hypothetical protein D3C80_1671140 [compost metagenome]
MNQQHATGQAGRCRHFLLEVEENVARIGRVVVLHLVAEHELVLEVHQAIGAVRLWRGLGYQAFHATTAVTGNVVPDDFHAALGDRERDSGLEVFQSVAAADQRGLGGVLLDGGKHVIGHGGTAVGRVNRHFV